MNVTTPRWAFRTRQERNNESRYCSVPGNLEMQRMAQRMDVITNHTLPKKENSQRLTKETRGVDWSFDPRPAHHHLNHPELWTSTAAASIVLLLLTTITGRPTKPFVHWYQLINKRMNYLWELKFHTLCLFCLKFDFVGHDVLAVAQNYKMSPYLSFP